MFHKQRQPNPDAKKTADASDEAKTKSPAPAETPTPSGTNMSQPTESAAQEGIDPKLKEYLQQIEQLKAEKQELHDKYLRLGADYANYQKRIPKQVSDSIAYEKRSFFRSLLGSLDNFEHALKGADALTMNPDAVKGWIDGIRMVHRHLLDTLKSQGVEPIVSVGAVFDPSIHEAIAFRSEPDKADGIVLEEFQAGYLFNGQALRPSKVIVNKLASASTPEETTDNADGSDSEGK